MNENLAARQKVNPLNSHLSLFVREKSKFSWIYRVCQPLQNGPCGQEQLTNIQWTPPFFFLLECCFIGFGVLFSFYLLRKNLKLDVLGMGEDLEWLEGGENTIKVNLNLKLFYIIWYIKSFWLLNICYSIGIPCVCLEPRDSWKILVLLANDQ